MHFGGRVEEEGENDKMEKYIEREENGRGQVQVDRQLTVLNSIKVENGDAVCGLQEYLVAERWGFERVPENCVYNMWGSDWGL